MNLVKLLLISVCLTLTPFAYTSNHDKQLVKKTKLMDNCSAKFSGKLKNIPPVNPFEVERAIISYPKVEEVVVLGAKSRHGDQLVRCVIVENSPCKEDEIIDHCKSRIADYKIPSIVEFVKELPKSQTGKILRQKLE